MDEMLVITELNISSCSAFGPRVSAEFIISLSFGANNPSVKIIKKKETKTKKVGNILLTDVSSAKIAVTLFGSSWIAIFLSFPRFSIVKILPKS